MRSGASHPTDAPLSASGPPTLDYRTPEVRARVALFAWPMPWPLALLCFGIATWPFWLTINSINSLYLRPMFHLTVGSILCGLALAAWYAAMYFIGRNATPLTVTQRNRAVRRFILTFGASVGFIALHAGAVPLNLLFALHRPWFEAARQNALSTLLPGQSAPQGRIGLFDVTLIQRGDDGEVGFLVDGNSIYFDPTPATPDCVFYPPNNGGGLVGGWRWEAVD